MKTKTRGYIIRRAAVVVLFWFAIVAFTLAVNSPNRWPGLSRRSAVLDNVGKAVTQTRTLTFTDRVAYQRAIEEVYWRHRSWEKFHQNSYATASFSRASRMRPATHSDMRSLTTVPKSHGCRRIQ